MVAEDRLERPMIVVLDDEQLILDLANTSLSDAGYEVVLVSSGTQAAAIFEGPDGERCRAFITDIHLNSNPVTGWVVARAARQRFPMLPIVYMTGGQADEWPSKGVPQSILLTKPFAPAQLVTAVSQLLNAVPVSAASPVTPVPPAV